jgi:DNA-binding beta-propeller fold protein YncE
MVKPEGAQGQIVSITQINYFDTGFSNLSTPLPIPATDPAGITFHSPSGHLIIADSEINEIPSAFSIVQANLFEVPLVGGTTFNEWNTTLQTGNEPSQNNEPTGIVYCEYDNHFYVTNDDARRLYRYAYDGSTITAVDSISLSGYANDSEDIACDPETGRLYVIGGADRNILVLSYDNGFVVEDNLSLPVTAGSPSGVATDPEGIVYDAGSGHLFVISSPDDAIFEYTLSGVFIQKFSLSGFSPNASQPQGITVAPSSDDPQTTSFYIADGMVDNDSDPNERDGRIFEARINRD